MMALPAIDLAGPGQELNGPSVAALCLLLVLCVAIAIIDWRHRIIPDGCNAAVAALGLAVAATTGTDRFVSAALQGLLVFALFWSVRRLYRALRPVHGLGLGDVKFMGAAGTWIGLSGVAPLILVACTTALAFIGVEMCRGKTISGRFAIPFGPFLVLGLVVVLGSSLT
ncbi:A24 family peptidase [Lichenifustis flavocetrariae]|uniref:A24 family peptidase n=1 Tax=Lichenifustis flavocetrariae TaxID=2949735 RepID=A0AA41YXA8_9HYPH|nr:A24 family peptidase [Lichenifustis flavocetrariae]MCW6508713.1 A24 family peptidase [Lichenifustis flavocetrariae]